jgi:hypothetical protein
MIAAIYARTIIVMLCCLLAVATHSASAQTDECGRMRNARREGENQMMALLASPLMTPAEQLAAAARSGMDLRYDPVPAAQARRQFQVQQLQQMIALVKQRELEACSASPPTTPTPSERRVPQDDPSGTPPAPARKDAPACPFGQYWNSVREQCVKIGE